jgi:hypothetical protein
MDFLSTWPGFAAVVVICATLIVIVLLLARRKARLKAGKEGVDLGFGTDSELSLSLKIFIDRTNAQFEDIKAGLKKCLDNQHEIKLDIMRLQILNTQMPPNDRLEKYDEYKKEGGNGWMDTYVEDFLKPEVERVMRERLVSCNNKYFT